MSDHDALLAAICADPDEDTPRLVFADYLEENGETERAAFIRTQIELARIPVWEPFAVRCRWRQPDTLTGRPFRHTLPTVDGFALEWPAEAFRRGLGWRLNVRSLIAWEQFSPGILGRVPVGELFLWSNATLDQWCEFAVSPVLPQLRSLHFMTSPIDPLRILREKPELRGVTDITFARASSAGMPEVVEDLLRSRLGKVVRGLHFHMGYESLNDILEALGGATRLERLSFSTMGLTAEHIQRLCEMPTVQHLNELELRGNPLGSAGVWNAVTASPPEVHTLGLAGTGATGEAFEAFARSPQLAGLRKLDLSRNPLSPRAARLLSRSHPLAGLRSLNLSKCRVGERELRHITRARFWRNLVELDLRGNPIPSAGVRSLLDAAVPPDLAGLILTVDQLGSEMRNELVRKFGEAVVFAPGE